MMSPVRVTAKIASLQTMLGQFNQTLLRTLDVQHKEAVREWLRAVIKGVPHYTGTSRGMFKPLGRVVKVAIPEKGPFWYHPGITSGKDKHQTTIRGRTYQLGFQQGEQYSNWNMYVSVVPGGYSYHFEFDQELIYAVWNDYTPAPPWMNMPSSTPWNSLEDGARRFVDYVRNVLPTKLPNPQLLVKITQVTVR